MTKPKIFRATYEGKEMLFTLSERGICQGAQCYSPLNSPVHFREDSLTNLREVEIHELGEVVIKMSADDKVKLSQEFSRGSHAEDDYGMFFNKIACRILNAITPPTPPMAEPTEFGAMVEASAIYDEFPGKIKSPRIEWVKTGEYWVNEKFVGQNGATYGLLRYWPDFINPQPVERK